MPRADRTGSAVLGAVGAARGRSGPDCSTSPAFTVTIPLIEPESVVWLRSIADLWTERSGGVQLDGSFHESLAVPPSPVMTSRIEAETGPALRKRSVPSR